MKRITTILLCFICFTSFAQSHIVPVYDPIPGAKLTINSLVAKTPLSISTGGGTDTVQCVGCVLVGTGLYPRITFWKNSSTLSSGANINIDSTNSRMGFGTTAPSNTITLDSVSARGAISGTTSSGNGGIVLNYTTDATLRRGHIYATTNGMNIMANEYSTGSATFFPLVLNNANAYVNSAGQLNGVGVNSTSTIQGNGDFTTSSSTGFFRTNNLTAIANNSAQRLQIVTQNQSSGDFNGVWIDATTNISQTGTTSFSVFKIGFNPTTTGSGKYSYINLGSITGANFITGWRVFSNNHTVIGDSTDAGELLRVNGAIALKYNTTATGITLDGSYCTVKVTATGQTITLPTAVGCTGRVYTIKLTASGSGTVATTSSQTIDASTTYSLSAQYKYVTVQSDGANWMIIANN